jgi:hypothetical protein
MNDRVRSLRRVLKREHRRWLPSLEVTVVLTIVATLAATLFYLAGLMSPELALLIGR